MTRRKHGQEDDSSRTPEAAHAQSAGNVRFAPPTCSSSPPLPVLLHLRCCSAGNVGSASIKSQLPQQLYDELVGSRYGMLVAF
jgi:hypothetical protein